jgi:hypothetical protein
VGRRPSFWLTSTIFHDIPNGSRIRIPCLQTLEERVSWMRGPR